MILGPLQRGDNRKNVKMGWGHLKIFSRTTRQNLTKPDTVHHYVKGIQVCSNEGYNPFTRGDNSERVKMHWKKKLKKSSSPEPAVQIQSNLVQIYHG